MLYMYHGCQWSLCTFNQIEEVFRSILKCMLSNPYFGNSRMIIIIRNVPKLNAISVKCLPASAVLSDLPLYVLHSTTDKLDPKKSRHLSKAQGKNVWNWIPKYPNSILISNLPVFHVSNVPSMFQPVAFITYPWYSNRPTMLWPSQICVSTPIVCVHPAC